MSLQNYNSETSEVRQENPQNLKRKWSFGPETDNLSIWSCPLAYLMLQLPCKIFNYVFRDLLDSFIIILLDNSIIFFTGHEPT